MVERDLLRLLLDLRWGLLRDPRLCVREILPFSTEVLGVKKLAVWREEKGGGKMEDRSLYNGSPGILSLVKLFVSVP